MFITNMFSNKIEIFQYKKVRVKEIFIFVVWRFLFFCFSFSFFQYFFLSLCQAICLGGLHFLRFFLFVFKVYYSTLWYSKNKKQNKTKKNKTGSSNKKFLTKKKLWKFIGSPTRSAHTIKPGIDVSSLLYVFAD